VLNSAPLNPIAGLRSLLLREREGRWYTRGKWRVEREGNGREGESRRPTFKGRGWERGLRVCQMFDTLFLNCKM